MIAFKQRQERSLRPGRTFHAPAAQPSDHALHVFHVEQVLRPQTGAFADGDELRGLVVGVTKRCQVFPFHGEFGGLLSTLTAFDSRISNP